jgi:uncharacterized membrane protein
MKWLSVLASFGLMIALTVSSSGCKKADQQTSKANKFTVEAPKDVNLAPGKTKTVTVKISRKTGFEDGTVKLSIEGLPKGVTCEPASPAITGKNNEIDITLSAANDAPETAKEATIAATANGDKGEVRFKVNVKK